MNMLRHSALTIRMLSFLAFLIFFTIPESVTSKPLSTLTSDEKQWLADHRKLRLGVGVAFPPYMWVEEVDGKKRFHGMVSDYIELLESRLGVDMEIIYNITFNEALRRGKEKKIDLFPCLSKTPERSEFLLFSKPYLSFPMVIMTRDDSPQITTIEDLHNKRFAVVKHLVVYSKLQNDHPGLNLQYQFTETVDQNLEAVSSGIADACIINLAAASYFISKKGLTNLRIAAPIQWEGVNLTMGVRDDWPVFMKIIEKALASVSLKEKDRISERWIKISHEPWVNVSLVWKWSVIIACMALLLFGVIFLWTRRLKLEVDARILAEKALSSQAKEQAAVAEFGHKVLGSVSVDAILADAVSIVMKTLDSEFVTILQHISDRKNYLIKEGLGWPEGVVGGGEVTIEHAVDAKESLLSVDSMTVSDFNLDTQCEWPGFFQDNGAVSGLFVVIGESLYPYGVLGVQTSSPRLFTGHEIDFLKSIANVIATAIARITTEKHIKSLKDLKEELLVVQEIDDRLQLITQGVVDIFGADFSRIWMSKDGDLCQSGCVHAEATDDVDTCRNRESCLHLISSSGRYTRIYGEHRRVPLGCYKIGRIASGDDERFLINDVANDPRVHDQAWANELGLISFAGYRILASEGTLLGVLALFKKSPIGPEEDLLLEELANTTAQVMSLGEAERARRLSEERLQLTIKGSSDAPWDWDLVEDELYFSPQWFEQLGYGPDELDGDANLWRRLIYPEELEYVERQIAKALSGTEDGYELEFRLRHKENHFVPVLSRGVITRDETGKAIRVTGTNMDLTERKQEEEEKIGLQNRLAQAQKMESIGNLAGGIAHDFNNILSSILGYAELALEDVDHGSELEDNLKEIYSAGKRAKGVVQQILTFARKTEEAIQPIKVSDIANEVLKLMRSSIPATVEITHNLASTANVLGSETQLHQVLMNLCTNAAQAMEKDGGVLEVVVEDVVISDEAGLGVPDLDPGNYVQIVVSDTGKGIAPDTVEHIFEPYFTTKGPGEGSGLGLAVVNGIIESYGGKIIVLSDQEKKTEFTIFLPATDKMSHDLTADDGREVRGAERILFVDDEPMIAKMGSRMLESLGYSVVTRTSSLEALELFRSQPQAFDLVVSDMTMPQMTGDKLAIEILSIRSEIPIILCTGYSNKINDETATAIGVKALTHKPIAKGELSQVVRQVLDGKQ